MIVGITSPTPVSTGLRWFMSQAIRGTSQREWSSRSVHQSHTRVNSTTLTKMLTAENSNRTGSGGTRRR